MRFHHCFVLAPVAAFLCSPAAAQGLMDMGKSLLQNEVSQQAGTASSASRSSLPTADIAAGIKEALKTGAERVTSQLGRRDGYNADPKVHIPLPDSLRAAQSAMRLAGASGLADDLELKINRAAEAAAPKAKSIFIKAVQSMTLDDARAVLNGPKDAATQYFKKTMTPDLKAAMRPVVDGAVAEAGVVQAYNSVAGASALSSGGKDMLTDYVLGHALDGLFAYLAREEAAIRTDPARQSTALLRKVFGR